MRRYLFLIPLLFLVFAAPRAAEAQSFCALSGVEWTRCYDFRTSTHGFEIQTVGLGPLDGGTYVPGSGFRTTAVEYDPWDPGFMFWRQWLQIRAFTIPEVNVQQLKLVYEWTPGIAQGNTDVWVTISPSLASWSKAALEAGSGTLQQSVSVTIPSGELVVDIVSAQCTACSSAEEISTGQLTLTAVVLGGTGTPPPGDEPSSGGGAPAELNLDVTPLYESISQYIPTFLAIFAIPGGIVLALALVRMIVNAVASAINGAAGK